MNCEICGRDIYFLGFDHYCLTCEDKFAMTTAEKRQQTIDIYNVYTLLGMYKL